jgi:LacI family transcriptional regulator
MQDPAKPDNNRGSPATATIKLRDIAAATGYSINTVSHALKDKPDIAPATKALICRNAREMGYIADALAGSLRSGRSRTIAVILGDMANPHFGLWVREIETAAFRQGICTLIVNTNEDERVELEAVRTVIGKRVDGIIICPTQKGTDVLLALKRSGTPFVLLGRSFGDPAVSTVVADDTHGGFLATRHLLDQGCRSILLLNGPDWISSSRDRAAGYTQALHAAGLNGDARLIRPVDVKSGHCRQVLREVLASGLSFDGIFAFSDLLALETLAVLPELLPGQTVPVVGFDDILAELHLPVSLVSIATDGQSLAGQALAVLLDQIEQQRTSGLRPQPIQMTVPVRLARHDRSGSATGKT